MELTLRPVAVFRSPLGEKFGVPRQSGLAPSVRSYLEFFEDFSQREAFREIEGFSHLWLIWGFSMVEDGKWRPTVRPPRLGGNKKLGVFASRSPYRPNPLGLSCVKFEGISFSNGRAVIEVSGADLADNTPIYDVKPYIPYADSITDASGGWADSPPERLSVAPVPESVKNRFGESDLAALTEILSLDPRPAYQDDPDRVYGLDYKSIQIKFRVDNNTVCVME